MKVIKRDGSFKDYDIEKISIAISGAFNELQEVFDDEELLNKIDYEIKSKYTDVVYVEQIQDIVEEVLCQNGYFYEGRKYIRYRYKKELVRKSNTTDKTINELLCGNSEYWNTENSNKNAKVVHTQRDYIAGITCTDITRRFLLPKKVVEAHDAGIIHFHDADYFAQNALHNCELCNLEDMLQNGTIINGVLIEKPHRILTAATIATQIIAAVTSSSYGGCSITLTHLAPFVRESYKQYLRKYKDWGFKYEEASTFAKKDTKKEVTDAVQTFLYQTNSMTNTNGQSPFLSVFMYLNETEEYKEELAILIEEFLNQRIIGFKNKKGVYTAPAFPKYLYVLEEDNITEDSKYWYLTKLAAECTSKRMVPDYISEKVMLKLKGDCYPSMGCRSFLTPDAANHKYYGRFNQGVVTINLADIALSSKGNFDTFWKLFDERTELCHIALQCRHERLSQATSDVSPILWQHGALARLQPGESLHPLLHNGYSTISLGYAALYECVKYMTGHSHTDNGVGYDFGMKVMQALNDKCNKWKAEEKIDYSIYGSPIESTTYKFAKSLKKRFGYVEGITDRDYVTNSYHVPVFEEIDAFSKLEIESKFQELSPGGAISYIELPDMKKNIDAILSLMKFMYDNIMYAEINLHIDYCLSCGYDGDLMIDDNMDWYCPNCGNRDKEEMSVTRRTCGYLGTNFWNKGRTQEIKERVYHLGDE